MVWQTRIVLLVGSHIASLCSIMCGVVFGFSLGRTMLLAEISHGNVAWSQTRAVDDYAEDVRREMRQLMVCGRM